MFGGRRAFDIACYVRVAASGYSKLVAFGSFSQFWGRHPTLLAVYKSIVKRKGMAALIRQGK